MGRCLSAAGTSEAARGPEFHDHKLTGLPGAVATVAYAKYGAINPSNSAMGCLTVVACR